MKIVIELNDDIDEFDAQWWIDSDLILKDGVKDCYIDKHCGSCKSFDIKCSSDNWHTPLETKLVFLDF